jgi:hypothetical protein
MSLVRGSQGLIYFVHQFKPTFIEAALLADDQMLAQVRAINHQIRELAPVLNGPTVRDGAKVESAPDVPVEVLVKRHGGSVYLFAVGMRDAATTARFQVNEIPDRRTVEVLGEGRSLVAEGGSFRDEFRPWDVHLYRIQTE